MPADITVNLNAYLAQRRPDERYTSFDYCHNYFQHARETGDARYLATGGCLEPSCLHLGFFLASWGMFRGGTELLQCSLHTFEPVTEAIANEEDATWELDVCDTPDRIEAILALGHRLGTAYNVSPTDALVTKTLLGVFGCVPGLDTYFTRAFAMERFGQRTLKFNRRSLLEIRAYYVENRAAINSHRIYTLDFYTGRNSDRRYPPAKLIDMIFYQQGKSEEPAAS